MLFSSAVKVYDASYGGTKMAVGELSNEIFIAKALIKAGSEKEVSAPS